MCNLFLIRCTACSSSPDGYSKLCSCQISAWMQKLWANIPINQTVNNKIIRGFNSSKLAKICQIWSPPSLGTCRYHEIKNLHSNCLCTHTWQASEHKLNDTRPINEWFVMCNSGDLSSDKNISMPDKAIETKQGYWYTGSLWARCTFGLNSSTIHEDNLKIIPNEWYLLYHTVAQLQEYKFEKQKFFIRFRWVLHKSVSSKEHHAQVSKPLLL